MAQRQREAHRDSKLYNTIVGVPAGLNAKINFELCCLARPQLAQRDGLKAGFKSFKARDCGKRKMSQDEAKQASKQLEAGFEAGPCGLG